MSKHTNHCSDFVFLLQQQKTIPYFHPSSFMFSTLLSVQPHNSNHPSILFQLCSLQHLIHNCLLPSSPFNYPLASSVNPLPHLLFTFRLCENQHDIPNSEPTLKPTWKPPYQWTSSSFSYKQQLFPHKHTNNYNQLTNHRKSSWIPNPTKPSLINIIAIYLTSSKQPQPSRKNERSDEKEGKNDRGSSSVYFGVVFS